MIRNQYSEEDAAFLQEVANQVAIAIANMKAHEEIASLNTKITRAAERSRTLLEINNAIIRLGWSRSDFEQSLTFAAA